MLLHVHVPFVGIEGYAMAEVMAEAVWPVRSSQEQLSSLQSYKSFLPYLSSGYEPWSQGIVIEEAYHCIVYSCDPLPRATTSLPPAKFGTTKRNVALLL